jgi:AP-4 complex subunit beta-1
VRLELLSATLKLFFQRPPEMQAMLGRLMAFFLDSDDLDPDLNDRAMFYYRLLKNDPEKCKNVVTPVRDPVDMFTEDKFDEIKETIMRQFNSLAVVYGLPAKKFTDAKYLILEQEDRDGGDEDDMGGMMNGNNDGGEIPDAGGDNDLLGFGGDQGITTTTPAPAPAAAPAAAGGGGGGDLLGDLLGFGGGSTGSEGGVGGASSLQLIAGTPVTQAAFQQSWMNLLPPDNQRVFTAQVGANLDLSALEGRLRAANVMTLASGAPGGNIKAYLYGQTAAGAVYFCELIVSQAGNAQGTCKSATRPGDTSLDAFAKEVETCLQAPAAGGGGGGNDLLGLF